MLDNPVSFAMALPLSGAPNISLANTLVAHQVSNVLYAWRNGQILDHKALEKIDEIVQEYREDIY